MTKPIEIFRAGKFTPMQGGELSFSAADLVATAGAYDPKVHDAPLVVGHPQLNAPAYGWATKLKVAGDRLVMDGYDRLDPAFAAMVNEGRFPKVSASFFRPDAKDNPKPGTWYLRHVGFLGAAAPAVEGLKPAQFAGADSDIVTFEFAAKAPSFMERVRARLAARFGAAPDQADDAAIDAAIGGALDDRISAAFAAHQPTQPKDNAMADAAELARQEAKLKEDQDKLAAQQASFAAAQRKTRDAADEAMIEALIKDGKILPAEKAQLVAFAAQLPADGIVEFAAADKSTVKKPAHDLFFDFLKGLPKRVEFKERAGGASGAVDFANPQSIADAAGAYQAEQAKAGRIIDAATAVAFVTRGNK